MSDMINFTNNYRDLSTETGFQFEFCCERCGDGVRSQFKPSLLGTANSVLNVASSFLGGLLGGASNAANSARNATWEREHDGAFRAAIEEVRPHFTRCPRCAGYVCQKCWNSAAGLCANCAPHLGTELAAAKSDRALQEMREKVTSSTQFSGDISAKQTTCPACGAPAGDMKFCGSCGARLGLRRCPNGHEVGGGMRFCGECGSPVGEG
ncbi:MAG: zinc ribbon domain-containing protein [Oscillochloris sp.]|nr:zinc ribbon domain-containing protein [Oscillochloris sp.]